MLARWRRPTSPTTDQAMVKWQLKVNLVQTSIIWEEGISEDLPMLGYPVGMSVREYLKSPMWEDSAYCGHHHSFPRKGLLNCIRVIRLSASRRMIIHAFIPHRSWLWMCYDSLFEVPTLGPYTDGLWPGMIRWSKYLRSLSYFSSAYFYHSDRYRTRRDHFDKCTRVTRWPGVLFASVAFSQSWRKHWSSPGGEEVYFLLALISLKPPVPQQKWQQQEQKQQREDEDAVTGLTCGDVAARHHVTS